MIGIGKRLGEIKAGNLRQLPEEVELVFSPGVKTGDGTGIAVRGGLQAGGNEPIGPEILM